MAAEYEHIFVVKATSPLKGVIDGDHCISYRPREGIPVTNHHPPCGLDHLIALIQKIHGTLERDAFVEQPSGYFGPPRVVVPTSGNIQQFFVLEPLVSPIRPTWWNGRKCP